MKFLLTSAGIKNDSIRNALVDLLGKPIADIQVVDGVVEVVSDGHWKRFVPYPLVVSPPKRSRGRPRKMVRSEQAVPKRSR